MKTDRLTGPPKENNYKWQIIVENAYKTSAFHHFRPKSNYSSVILGNKNYAVKNICLVISARYLKHPNFLQGLLTIIARTYLQPHYGNGVFGTFQLDNTKR